MTQAFNTHYFIERKEKHSFATQTGKIGKEKDLNKNLDFHLPINQMIN